MLFAIEVNQAQMNQLLADDSYRKIMAENPNAIIVLCQNNTIRILHDAAKRDKNRPTIMTPDLNNIEGFKV